MVSIINDEMTSYVGLSSDTKPGSVANGSAFYEIDTGKLYFYDADGSQWVTAS